MTICIAAACITDNEPSEHRLILCADRLLSGPLGKAETGYKIRLMSPRWRLLTAGDDDEIQAMVSLCRHEFSTSILKDEKRKDSEILSICKSILETRKRQKAEELIQSQYAMSYDEFVKIGKDKLPDGVFRDALYEIRSLKLRGEFILAGFCGKFPFIVELKQDFTLCIREEFATVGSGAFLAHSALMHRALTDVSYVSEALYAVWEAKKAAERESAVGEHTLIYILDQDGNRYSLNAAGSTWLDEQYAQYGPKELPELILDMEKTLVRADPVS